MKLTIHQRVLNKLIRSDGDEDRCWLFSGAKNNMGYGVIRDSVGRKNKLAHRVMWEYTTGSLNDRMRVLHKCDTPACCNPSHLFLGTAKDNTQDMMKKGRGTLKPGEQHPGSSLTENDVKGMRERYATGTCSYSELSREYGVSQMTAWCAVNRKTWKHVE